MKDAAEDEKGEFCLSMSDEQTLRQNALRIRRNMMEEFSANRGGHMGGSLDLAEMLAVVYTDFLRVDPAEPRKEGRDFMIFSKGHAGPALYAALAFRGFFGRDRLRQLNKPSSKLPGHCDRNHVPGVDATTGSLGQGLSMACGVALGAKIAHRDQRVFCVTGDGESAEGQVWEAAQFAAHYHLDNLIAFLDWNKKQIDGTNDEVMELGDAVAKYRAFGWNACRVAGDDVLAIQQAVQKAVAASSGRPTMIVLDTVKGGNIAAIANLENNHCIGLPDDLKEQALADLRAQAEALHMEVDA